MLFTLRTEALQIIFYIKAEVDAAEYPLCPLTIDTIQHHKDEQEKNQQGDVLWKVLVSLPHVDGNMPTVQILAGFSLFVFLPPYVPAAGLLGLLP